MRVKSRTARFLLELFFWVKRQFLGSPSQSQRFGTPQNGHPPLQTLKKWTKTPRNQNSEPPLNQQTSLGGVEDDRSPREPQQAHVQGLEGVKGPGGAHGFIRSSLTLSNSLEKLLLSAH